MKEQLDNTLKLWSSTVNELKEMQSLFSLEKLNNQFYRRILLKNIFSIIESYLFISRELVRIKYEVDNKENSLGWKDYAILSETKAALNKKGEVVTIENYQPFIPTLKFSLNIFSKAFGTVLPDFSSHQFEKLQEYSKRRNDITHPKDFQKIIITDYEIKELIPMLGWFIKIHGDINVEFQKWFKIVYPTL